MRELSSKRNRGDKNCGGDQHDHPCELAFSPAWNGCRWEWFFSSHVVILRVGLRTRGTPLISGDKWQRSAEGAQTWHRSHGILGPGSGPPSSGEPRLPGARTLAKHRYELGFRHRAREEVALADVTAHVPNGCQIGGVLQPFRDCSHTEVMGKLDNGARDAGISRIHGTSIDETA